MVLGGLLAASPTAVGAAPLSGQPFSAYGSGAALVTEALELGPTTVAGVIAANSGGAVSSGGLNTPIINEMGINIAPVTPGRNALGRGTGLEVGLLTEEPQATTLNQLLLSGLAVATAPPPSGLVSEQIALDLDPVAFAGTLQGEAQAIYDPTFCPVGRPLTYGMGNAENLQVLNTSATPSDPVAGFDGSLLGTSTDVGTDRSVSQSRTVTYLAANGDGTFGVVSETRQTVAPVELLGTLPGTGLVLEIAGEFGLRVAATGKPGGASAAYTGNPVITVTQTVAGLPVPVLGPITLQDLLGTDGLTVDLPGILTVSAGAPPRALNGALGTAPALAADGTSASAAVDAVRLGVLDDLLGLSGIDLRLGHMEGAVSVPAGGLTCDIPVSKTASVDPVLVGQDFTYTISIPSDAALFEALYNCDLVNISAVDTVETQEGNPSIQLLSASNGGVISGNTVTWANLGNYTLGQEPIVLTINARIPANSGAGVLRDTVNVSATLGNCQGGATGEDIVQGGAQLDGSAITGSFTLVGPNVSRGDLAATGGTSWPLAAGGGILLAALGLVRLRRRVAEAPTS